MNKQIITIIILVSLISCAYAFDIELAGGESVNFTLSEEPDKYEIFDNLTSLEELTITINGTEVTILAGFLIEQDTFRIVFYRGEEVVDEVEVKRSGGGICYRGWTVGEFSECINNQQTREVTKDWKTCYQTKQEESFKNQFCEIINDDDLVDTTDDNAEGQTIYTILLIVVIIGIFVGLFFIIKKFISGEELYNK